MVFFAANLFLAITAEAKVASTRPFLRFRCTRAGSPLEFRGLHDVPADDAPKTVQGQKTNIAPKSVGDKASSSSGLAGTKLVCLPLRGICAHRGESVVFPENTVPAFREAARLGAHQIEFDVCVTKDGKHVVMHDLSVDRTTNGTGRIADLTFSEIRGLDAGIKKGERFKGTKVPTFDEAIDCMPCNVWINIHLKKDVDGAVIARAVCQKNRLHQAFLACTLEQAAQARAVCPNILICNMSRQPAAEYVDRTIANASAFIQILKSKYSTGDIAKLHKAHVQINCYGIAVKDPDSLLKQMFDEGIDFPLVDTLDHMLRKAEELGIPRWKPVWNEKPQ